MQNRVILAGIMFVRTEKNNNGTTVLFTPQKRNIGKIPPPMKNVANYMAEHGILRHFLNSLKPENQQEAGCM